MQDSFTGVYRAVVVSTKDPASKRRVRVKSPQVSGNAELQWAEPVNSGSPIPSVNSIIWIMFNGGYINKPVYLPTDTDQVWIKPTLVSGYTHDGNDEGDVMYTLYTERGTRYMEWQGGMDVNATGVEGSFAVPNGGTFFTLANTDFRPSSRRTLLASKNNYTSANYFNNSVKVDFNTNGTCSLVASAQFETTWVSLNGFRYPL